jgi:membrane dipeptidase
MWREKSLLTADEARALHADALVVDTAYAGAFSVPSERIEADHTQMLQKGFGRFDMARPLRELAVAELRGSSDARRDYLDLLARSGVSLGLTTTAAMEPSGEGGFEEAIRVTADVLALIQACEGELVLALRAADIERAHREKKPALAIMWQNTTPIGHELDRLSIFHALGLRSAQLTYNVRNLVGDGCTERNASGLSRFGVAVVERLNELRIAVDASHSSEKVGWDALEHSKVPISLNHTSAKAVYEHDRGKGDDLIRAVARAGGFVGVVLIAGFIGGGSDVSLDDVAAHVEHIARVAGVDAVGIGADTGTIYGLGEGAAFERYYRAGYPWHGFTASHRTFARNPVGFKTIEDWPNVTVALARRGFNEDELRKILGLNYLRFFRDVVG